MDLNNLILLNNLAKTSGNASQERRVLYSMLAQHTDRTFVGLLGPRGVGKTVLLKQLLANTSDAFYISVDSLDPDTDLFQLVQQLHQSYKFTTFLLDEVHYLDQINKYLKLIFDNLNVRVIFTSSIVLKLLESAHDLSRRVKLISIPPFSFPEFLKFNKLPTAAKLHWDDLLNGQYSSEHAATLPYLKKYLTGGNYPFSLEVVDVLSALRSNLEKIIQFDIPKLRSLTTEELPLIMKTFKFVGRSPSCDINPNVISNNLKITRYKAEQYVRLLESAFVLKQVFPAGTNLTKEPKILCGIPYRLLEQSYDECIGGLREDFAVSCLVEAGLEVEYLKGPRGVKTPDFLVHSSNQSVIIEIGGPGKTFEQFKGIDRKYRKVIFADGIGGDRRALPLALLGFLQ